MITLDLELLQAEPTRYDEQGREDHRLTDNQLAQQFFRDMHGARNDETDIERFMRYIDHARKLERERCVVLVHGVLEGKWNVTQALKAVVSGKDEP